MLRACQSYFGLRNCSKDCCKDEGSSTDAKAANDQESLPGAHKCTDAEQNQVLYIIPTPRIRTSASYSVSATLMVPPNVLPPS